MHCATPFSVIYNPDLKRPECYPRLVLPVGARSAVMAFCRTSQALWLVALVLLQLHLSVFCDDFVVVCAEAESKHVELAVTSYFALLGGEVSSEKDAVFASCARALGGLILGCISAPWTVLDRHMLGMKTCPLPGEKRKKQTPNKIWAEHLAKNFAQQSLETNGENICGSAFGKHTHTHVYTHVGLGFVLGWFVVF